MLKLLGRKTSGNVQKVVWLLEELGAQYEREDYGRQFGNTETPDYLRLNPNAKVPTLVDGDVVIWESNTILRYLANKAGGRFYADDAAGRCVIERWMDWQLSTHDPAYLPVFRLVREKKDPKSPDFVAAVAALGKALEILERSMAGTWIAGEGLTIADICLGPGMDRCFNFPVELPALPRLRRWHEALKNRAGFRKATG